MSDDLSYCAQALAAANVAYADEVKRLTRLRNQASIERCRLQLDTLYAEVEAARSLYWEQVTKEEP